MIAFSNSRNLATNVCINKATLIANFRKWFAWVIDNGCEIWSVNLRKFNFDTSEATILLLKTSGMATASQFPVFTSPRTKSATPTLCCFIAYSEWRFIAKPKSFKYLYAAAVLMLFGSTLWMPASRGSITKEHTVKAVKIYMQLDSIWFKRYAQWMHTGSVAQLYALSVMLRYGIMWYDMLLARIAGMQFCRECSASATRKLRWQPRGRSAGSHVAVLLAATCR